MKQRIFSGIQPSGNLHIGNYLGAINQWIPLQDQYEALFCVVDLHAITVPQDPETLRQKTLEIAKIYLASGIDPEKCTLFVQSHVKEHAELMWILNSITKISELERMTQYKDKAGIKKMLDIHDVSFEAYTKNVAAIEAKLVEDLALSNKDSFSKDELISYIKDYRGGVERPLLTEIKSWEEIRVARENTGSALHSYPVLMAADILLYDTVVVPVGKDQMQHIELTRTLAERFNKRFGNAFIIPEGKLSKEGQVIMGLDDPTKKMSKSAASEYNYIALSDDAEVVRKKIRKAVTDSGSEIVYRDDKPALMNLINIYTLLSGKSTAEVEEMYRGKGYGDFKDGLAEVVISFLAPFQERLAAISDEEVEGILRKGAEKARVIAKEKMRVVNEKVGFLAE